EFRLHTFKQLKTDTETLVEFNLRLLGRQRALNETIKCNADIGDEFVWKIWIEQHINGDWKPIPIKMEATTCPFLELFYGKYWDIPPSSTNLPMGKDSCPIRKGEYYLKNMSLHLDNWMQFGKEGLNRCKLTISKNDIVHGGFIGVAVLTEI
ncbi:hypothetical protein KR200_011235, partial [Drosophila serrata]